MRDQRTYSCRSTVVGVSRHRPAGPLPVYFLWKCMHNIFRVGPFWNHMENLEIFGQCPHCRVDESLEHIMLECDAPRSRQVWRLCSLLWGYKYGHWPRLNWGVLLGSNLVKFRSAKGKLIPHKQRLFTILVSTSMYLIWTLRNERRFDNHDELHSNTEIHNRWVSAMDAVLKRDRLLTSNIHFGRLAFNRQMVLNTWSGALWDEDSLPDDWIQSDRVLVGIRPIRLKRGIG
ncbi:hypothetical protein C8R47DRAFT_967331 [Mycena vitilis]|nr:hypothetical protein C8R47DRAFT_967331 [Mycena vitilis]